MPSSAGNWPKSSDRKIGARYTSDTMLNGLWVMPSFLSGTSLIVTFLVALLVFHWAFVFCWQLDKIGIQPLGKRGWKIADYVWLSAGSIALVATAFQARQLLATNMLNQLDAIVGSSVDPAQYYSSPEYYDGLLCKKFERNPLYTSQAEFDRIQNVFDTYCAWAGKLTTQLVKVDRWTVIDVSGLPVPPKADVNDLASIVRELYGGIDRHNVIARKREALRAYLSRSDFELTLAELAPLLAIIALALRVAKVTGEIRLEQR